MKKLLPLILFLCTTLGLRAADADAVVTLTTDTVAGTSIELLAYCSSSDQAFKVDWGDGNVKSYNVDPNSYGYAQRINETVKGSTITITGPLVKLQLRDAALTSATFANQTALKDVDLSENKLAEVTFDANMLALEDLDLSYNKLTALTFPEMPSLTTLNLNHNQIDSHQLDISALAGTMQDLKLNNNQLVTLNLMAFTALQYFDASYNPDLTTVVFADGNSNLRQINMSNCYIMHFYGISLPNLSSLTLNDNALLELEGTHNYPNLSSLSVANNYLTELDVTPYTNLYSLYCNGNQLTELNVSTLSELNSLNCANNQLKNLDLSLNTQLTTLYCDSNKLTKLDISKLSKISTLSVSGNHLTSVDLKNAYYLKEFRAADTDCSVFYFNYVNAWGQFRKVDVRNNKNMTSESINFMFRTMPTYGGSSYNTQPSILIEGSNGEHSDPSYVTSSDMGWIVDVTGDGTATNSEINVTIDAEDTGDDITITGQYGGMVSEQSVTLTKYATDNGTFTISQWSGSYYQQLSDVTTKAKKGVQIMVSPTPAEGYKFKSVTINGIELADSTFIVSDDATIKVNFTKGEKLISFTTAEGQTLSFKLYADANNTPVAVDWGNGSRQESTIGTSATYFDGTAAGTTVKIYGDVTKADFESYGEYGDYWGLPNNNITGIDLSGNDGLKSLILYMNPIQTLDVSNQKSLEYLDCDYCELAALDVSNNTELTALECYGNNLSTLDVSKCTKLESLNAKVNNLSSISLDANSSLTELDLTGNQLASIDLAKLTKLESLKIANNQLTAIDLSHNATLYELTVGGNKLTDINVDACTYLQALSFNDNAIHMPDLSQMRYLRSIDCGGNGMDACELDDFYYLLPQRYDKLDGDETPTKTLTVLTGSETTPNDAYNADGAIATAKGWDLNIAGNASGCDKAYIIVKQSAHGTIKLIDTDGNKIVSGDKTKKNSTITIAATPDNGYELKDVKANTLSVGTTSFEITRMTEVVPEFALSSAIKSASANNMSINGHNGAINLTVSADSQVSIYNMQGACMYSNEAASQLNIPLAKGAYLVRVTTNGVATIKKVVVE